MLFRDTQTEGVELKKKTCERPWSLSIFIQFFGGLHYFMMFLVIQLASVYVSSSHYNLTHNLATEITSKGKTKAVKPKLYCYQNALFHCKKCVLIGFALDFAFKLYHNEVFLIPLQ